LKRDDNTRTQQKIRKKKKISTNVGDMLTKEENHNLANYGTAGIDTKNRYRVCLVPSLYVYILK